VSSIWVLRVCNSIFRPICSPVLPRLLPVVDMIVNAKELGILELFGLYLLVFSCMFSSRSSQAGITGFLSPAVLGICARDSFGLERASLGSIWVLERWKVRLDRKGKRYPRVFPYSIFCYHFNLIFVSLTFPNCHLSCVFTSPVDAPSSVYAENPKPSRPITSPFSPEDKRVNGASTVHRRTRPVCSLFFNLTSRGSLYLPKVIR